jgi:hypothetical protein
MSLPLQLGFPALTYRAHLYVVNTVTGTRTIHPMGTLLPGIGVTKKLI